ncbi:MAG: 23S rRNA (guanosine(2251)-2'-O)-methyltransferase RlmB [Porticoccaceae bacterium]|nr:23S rRNA (guanosine(2251)-2'-O)-methyltransferase RlmB [Pseudomonadales bacterium]MCP5172078.1 23S rRNA (guanosine(2251)-2'-O)-methyltransferase RlmB [Pseudomonadales bacterium]
MKQSLQWVFGVHAVQAMLKTSAGKIQELRLQKGRDDQRFKKIQSMAEQQGVPTSWVLRSDLDTLADGQHQGVAALCEGADVQDENFLSDLLVSLDHPPLILVLDGVTDPHNLGACLRSCDAAGVDVVVAPKDRSVGITPVVKKVACGAAESVPLVVVTNLARTLKFLQQQGVWVVGTAGEAQQLIYEADLSGPLALVMGAEEKGLRRLTRENCDLLVKLPMAGAVSSLNVSVASGVCLFEAVRQRARV